MAACPAIVAGRGVALPDPGADLPSSHPFRW